MSALTTDGPFETRVAMAPSAAATGAAPRAVRTWLWLVAALVFAMVLVGGATRLTGSGLSITEWKPVTGAMPPLTDAAWTTEFEKYRGTPQYEIMNRGMGLDAFKTIYWWEWGHRQLGRLIGLAFLAPLAWFALRGAVRGRRFGWLLALGALGGLQAAIGWIMVASGLRPGMTAVAPVKLMLHLLVASFILAGLVATATRLSPARRDGAVPRGLRVGAGVLLGAVLVQIALGGLVAGSDAGLVFNTWPLMDGRLLPPADSLWAMTPWPANLFANVATIQATHRLGAYLLLALAVLHALQAARAAPGTGAARRAAVLAGLVGAQAVVGIVTLILAVPLWAGLAHQGMGMVVLAMAAVHLGASLRDAGTRGEAGAASTSLRPLSSQ